MKLLFSIALLFVNGCMIPSECQTYCERVASWASLCMPNESDVQNRCEAGRFSLTIRSDSFDVNRNRCLEMLRRWWVKENGRPNCDIKPPFFEVERGID